MPVLEKNSTLTLLKIASSITFTNFALAVGLYMQEICTPQMIFLRKIVLDMLLFPIFAALIPTKNFLIKNYDTQ